MGSSSWTLRQDDGIGVEVEDLLGFQIAQTLSTQFESCRASGETGYEDVDVVRVLPL